MRWTAAVLIVLAAAAGGCARRIVAPGTPAWIQSDTAVALHGHALKLHLSTPVPPVTGPLLVYATGDAGWFRKDRELFDHVAGSGFPAVGFSSREYLRHLGSGVDVIGGGVLVSDYAAVIGAALRSLGLPSGTPAVLVGKSRGAGLAVAAASESSWFRRRLKGIIAIGLTREEEYVRSRFWRRPPQREVLDTYAALTAIRRLPVSVIQSTRDEYVTAGEARVLMGGDTAERHLRPVDSQDHNFGGARDAMYDTMRRELRWIVDR